MATQATKQSSKQSSLFIWVTIGLVIAFLMMMIIAAFGGSQSSNQGPNPYGAQAASPIDPTDPRVVNIITRLQSFTDKDKILNASGPLLNSIITDLTNSLNVPNLTAAQKAQIQLVLDDFNCVKTNQVNNKPQAAKCAVKAYTDKKALNKMFNGTVAQAVQFAIDMANYNISHPGAIAYGTPHMNGKSSNNIPGTEYPTYADCSGYMYAAFGHAKLMTHYMTTASLRMALDNHTDNIVGVIYHKGTILSRQEVLDAASNGTMAPGDMLLKNGHVRMYIGGTDPEKNVVESYGVGQGPLFTSLKKKADNIIAIIRISPGETSTDGE